MNRVLGTPPDPQAYIGYVIFNRLLSESSKTNSDIGTEQNRSVPAESISPAYYAINPLLMHELAIGTASFERLEKRSATKMKKETDKSLEDCDDDVGKKSKKKMK